MGQIESVAYNEISCKTSKVNVRGQTITIKEVVDHYNNIINSLKFFQDKANEYLKDSTNKEREISKLRRELMKLKNVLDTKSDVPTEGGGTDVNSSSLEETMKDMALVAGKRYAISAEAVQKEMKIEAPKTPKSLQLKQTLYKAFISNDFMENLDKTQINELVDFMEENKIKAGEYVIKEGDEGDRLFIVEEGLLEVLKNEKVVSKDPLSSGTLFGELAILYKCKRTASVRAITDSVIWQVRREIFQYVMQNNVTVRRLHHLAFLKSVPSLAGIDDGILKKVTDLIEESYYTKGEYIIQENDRGNIFYIIQDGTVDVFKKVNNVDQKLRSLYKGDYFGEKALLCDDIRSASVVAASDQVTCLCLNREIFLSFAGSIADLKRKKYDDGSKSSFDRDDAEAAKRDVASKRLTEKIIQDREQTQFHLNDFIFISNLGQGAFGKVDLIEHLETKKRYAIKRMEKMHIVKTKQQDHVNNERRVLLSSNCDFIVYLYQTFRDNKYIYLLTDACLAGDLFTIMHQHERFDPKAARFYVACVIEAFEYLHKRGYVYRDLKPENMLMDSKGYIKLVDFGFAKKILDGEKTFTFCGTPEYVAPEVILSKGHDKTADYWSLGILVFELINGSPPFTSNDSMNTYRMILRGLDSINFPKKIPKYAANLIKSLCKENPSERLGNTKEGINAIRKHRWYEGFHWSGLKKGILESPIVPKIPTYNYPDKQRKIEPNRDSGYEEFAGWDEEF